MVLGLRLLLCLRRQLLHRLAFINYGQTLLPVGTGTERAKLSATAKFMDQTLGEPDIANPTLKYSSSRTHSQGSREGGKIAIFVLAEAARFVGEEDVVGSGRVHAGVRVSVGQVWVLLLLEARR
ncbi:hypothetical protein LR48_Vigan07g073400 [Vigna angularis]|uniref:Uncharacterized protein n=1 Tax=Phaseolus angularis TaxID=3914 RepID=A0A0L9UW09_PHAAN|nr:hypothetical protein LR48_Vigan07g073400 [Vigna angularis]